MATTIRISKNHSQGEGSEASTETAASYHSRGSAESATPENSSEDAAELLHEIDLIMTENERSQQWHEGRNTYRRAVAIELGAWLLKGDDLIGQDLEAYEPSSYHQLAS